MAEISIQEIERVSKDAVLAPWRERKYSRDHGGCHCLGRSATGTGFVGCIILRAIAASLKPDGSTGGPRQRSMWCVCQF